MRKKTTTSLAPGADEAHSDVFVCLFVFFLPLVTLVWRTSGTLEKISMLAYKSARHISTLARCVFFPLELL